MSKADADPIDFLNSMRQRTAHLLGQLDAENNVDVSDIARAVPKTGSTYDDAASSKAVLNSRAVPPDHISPEDEVEWWKRRIADLSVPTNAQCEGANTVGEEKSQMKDHETIGSKMTSKGSK